MKFQLAKHKLLEIDLKGCLYLNHFSHSLKTALFFKMISRLGDGVFWCVMLGIVWLLQGISYSVQVLYMLSMSGFGTLLYKVLKQKTLRPRPYQVHQVIRLGERPLDHFSFPSGHTLHAVMISTLLGYVYPILLIVMLPFTVLVALSRMVLGLHYPSDVAVGAGLGAMLATAIIQLAPYFDVVL